MPFERVTSAAIPVATMKWEYQRRTQKGKGLTTKTVAGRTGKTQRKRAAPMADSAIDMVRFFFISSTGSTGVFAITATKQRNYLIM
jgi:hypothetical protein